VVLVTDGIPDAPGKRKQNQRYRCILPGISLPTGDGAPALPQADHLPPVGDAGSPQAAAHVDRDGQVMVGWKTQVKPGVSPRQQDDLWKWVLDNVDYRVRAGQVSRRFQN